MKIYKDLDYDAIQKAAFDLIINAELKELPINLFKIIKKLPNLRIRKYSRFAKENNLTLTQVCDMFNSSDGCCQWHPKSGNCVIFYNDTIQNKGRIRFTIAHEIGHYILEHHLLAKIELLSRSVIPEKLYDFMESEANYFAKSLLAPLPLIFDYMDKVRDMDHYLIADIFRISKESAYYVSQNINNTPYRIYNTGISDQFSPYILSEMNQILCCNCNSINQLGNNHCSQCGEILESELTKGNYQSMLYFGIKPKNPYLGLSETECPNCHNDIGIKGFTVCHKCNTFIKNICLGSEQKKLGTGSKIIARNISAFEKDLIGCGDVEGNCRHCPDCGALTSYGLQELIPRKSTLQNAALKVLGGVR